MNKLKLSLGVFLIFVLGAMAGSVGMKHYIQTRFDRAFFHDSPNGPPPRPPFMHPLIGQLDRELHLNGSQIKEIEKIVNQTFKKIHAVLQKHNPDLNKVLENELKNIRDTLNSEQRERFDQLNLFEKMKKRMPPHFPSRQPFAHDIKNKEPGDFLEATLKRLILNDTQTQPVREILALDYKTRQEIKMEQDALIRANVAAMKEKLQRLDSDTEKRLSHILTEKQLKIFQEICPERPMERHGHKMPPPMPHGIDCPQGPHGPPWM